MPGSYPKCSEKSKRQKTHTKFDAFGNCSHLTLKTQIPHRYFLVKNEFILNLLPARRAIYWSCPSIFAFRHVPSAGVWTETLFCSVLFFFLDAEFGPDWRLPCFFLPLLLFPISNITFSPGRWVIRSVNTYTHSHTYKSTHTSLAHHMHCFLFSIEKLLKK